MSIYDYINAQRANLASITRLPHFGLIDLMDKLYDRSIDLARSDLPPRYGCFLLLAHQSFLSAATLIVQAQPFDAGSITRRAIEIARVCLASKHDRKIEEKWVAYEKRMQRWKARQHGGKLERLPPFSYDYQGQDSLMKSLNDQHGILSDSFAHFTPEYYAYQNWRVKKTDYQRNTVELLYFITDQKTLERELILLADTHWQILNVIDHCMDYTLSKNDDWKRIAVKLVRDGRKFGELFAREQAGQV
jgi:hypothetical protein